MSQRSSDPELNGIESALGGLVPVPSRLNRDALMFEAGAASARSAPRGRWVWPSIAAMLAVALASESLVLAVRPTSRVVERIVVVREPVPATSSPTSNATVPHPASADSVSDARSSQTSTSASFWPATSEYQRIQELVLRLGLDALPERSSSLVSRSDRSANPVDAAVPSAGNLRRLELEKLLNLSPGGPS